MRIHLTLVLIPLTMNLVAAQDKKPAYPEAKRLDLVETLHGRQVADPYRWLEDTDSPQTAEWVTAENKLTNSFLEAIPGRDKYKARLTELSNYERYASLFKRGGRYFISKNSGLQNQNVFYTADSLDGPERVLLDPNTLRKDGTAAITGFSVSRDGKLLAYGIAQAGSDWTEWHVRDVATGQDRPDLVQWTKFGSIAWKKDNSGFFYPRFPQPESGKMLTSANINEAIYFHKLGDPQESDKVVFERPDQPHWMMGPDISDDGRYLLINISAGDAGKNLIFYQDLQAAEPKTVELIHDFKALYDVLGNDGPRWYLSTTDAAPKGRIIAIDLATPEAAHWKTLIPEQADTLEGALYADRKFALTYLKDAHSQVKIFAVDGKPVREVQLPGIGSAGFYPTEQNDTEAFYHYATYTSPAAIYRLDMRSGRSTEIRSSKLSFDPARYETEEIFYTSKDGTRVPMFLIHRKGLKLDGQNPTILYGYGGFNIPETPGFSPDRIAWLEMGGLWASACLRGGSEYGEAWHLAGTKAHKQNVFDDFIAAAEWLIAKHYTSTPKLAIFGGSNGGLLVGAVLNQRPDLFGAAMPAVGVMDMLRFHKFTVGAGWVGDYGTPDNADDFKVLRAYSPYHNIRAGVAYPPTLITTSDHDDRVVPGHSFKYAAALQAAQSGPNPILIRIETRAGHGGGKPTSKRIEEFADRLAFLTQALHMNETNAGTGGHR